MKKIVFLFMSISLFVGCNLKTETKKEKIEQESVGQAPIVGADSDEHGCKGSAGFQWSEVRKECIQIFSTGIRLDPKAKELNQSLSAFIVFKSDTEDGEAELFLPGEQKSILLKKVKKEDAGTWTNEKYNLTQWKGMYSLEDNKKILLYQGHAK